MEEQRFQFYQAAKTGEFPTCGSSSSDGIALYQQGAINMYAMVPCPLRPRFNRSFQTFIDEYNVSHSVPAYVPTLAGLDHDEVDEIFARTEDIDQMPEVIISTGNHWIFQRKFRQRYIESGAYVPYIPSDIRQKLPSLWKMVAETYALGVLALGGWGLVYDLSFGEPEVLPQHWNDLADTRYAGAITVHGCDGSPGSSSLLAFIRENGGETALEDFSRNVKEVKHFSQILNHLDKGQRGTPYSILPGPAIGQIPSHKRAAKIELKDGDMLMPMAVLVKADRIAQVEPVMNYFYSDEFRSIMNFGGFVHAGELTEAHNFASPNWEELCTRDADELADELVDRFNRARQGVYS